ncbi:MAG TPA: hypothetical protein DD379_05865 [Cyanobacteria bacterium UBA11162]|nr:hypothetical protein [Cyanobacteria bacterium UBA11162]
MSQNTSIESSTHSQFQPSLNPTLQAALGSLDVQLEDELARYRRQRIGRPVRSPRGLVRSQTRKPIELISTDRITNALPSSVATAALLNQTPKAELTQKEAIAHTPQLNGISQTHRTTPSVNDESVTEQPNSPQNSENSGDLVHSPVQTPPDDYLESSEQLLRSLAEQEAGKKTQTKTQKKFSDRILTPLGVGSILLLLVSSASLTYILTNPSLRTSLGLGGWFGTKTPTAQNPTQTTPAPNNFVNPSPIIQGPNLASDEFSEVGLNTLAHLETSPNPTSTTTSPVSPVPTLPNSEVTQSVPPPVTPLPAVPGRVPDLPAAILSPPQQQGGQAPTGSPVPSPSKSATTKPNTEAAKQQSSSTPNTPSPSQSPKASPSPTQATTPGAYYLVVADYTGEPSLEQVKTIVPDAYVEQFPDGVRIQIGAFKLESEAKQLVEQLQQQGISAGIRR